MYFFCNNYYVCCQAVCRLSMCATKTYIMHNLVIVFPLQAKEEVRGGDIVSARKSAQNALYCNIASIVGAVIAYVSLVVVVPVVVIIGFTVR